MDTYLLSSSPDTNNGTSTGLWVGEGNNATNRVARSLIKFDLSSTPANAVITSATLSLWTDTDFSDNDRTIRVYRLKVPFNETQATWNEASSGVSWQSPGASGTNDRESTDIVSILILADEPLDTEKQISLSTAQIQEMVSGAFTNNGFIIIADTELDDRFNYKSSDATAATKRPKLVIQYTTSSATSTPTNTPTPGPSPTPTNTSTPTVAPTATATNPPSGTFNNAIFVYDGDGTRVKSIFNGNTTTYFVGTHYEVTGSTITKYYGVYGANGATGSQRIAMRTNGTLHYLLGDHLGSTSLVTDAAGNKINEQRYKAWGETRYTFGNEKTKYQYTGQFSYESDFGLMYYGARWYDPSLGRLNQPDTIIPDPNNSQAWDRYSYTFNNPVRYIDPDGHFPIIPFLAIAAISFLVTSCAPSPESYASEEWESQALSTLKAEGGQEGSAAVGYIINSDVHLVFAQEDQPAAWHPFSNNIYLDSDQYSEESDPTDPYMLSIIAHEAKHLEQSWLEAISVSGEVEAWQIGFEIFRTMTEQYPGNQIAAENIMTLDPNNMSPEDINNARQWMKDFDPTYRADDLLDL